MPELAGIITLTMKPLPSPAPPPRTATMATTSFLSDTMVVSFGYSDPTLIRAGASITLEANVFEQIAMSRTAFASFMKNAIELMAQMPDRETLAWSELKQMMNSPPPKTN
jgi:hypothetical protein